MANPNKSEVGFEVDGKAYTLKLSTNAICEIEDVTGKGINEFAEGLGDTAKFRIRDLRTIFYACLVGGGSSISQDATGDLMDAVGMEEVGELVQKAFQVAFPEAVEDEGKTKAAA